MIENNTSIFRQFIEPYFKVLEFGGFKAEFLRILFIFQNETVTKIKVEKLIKHNVEKLIKIKVEKLIKIRVEKLIKIIVEKLFK